MTYHAEKGQFALDTIQHTVIITVFYETSFNAARLFSQSR